jgi:hypothetical protein
VLRRRSRETGSISCAASSPTEVVPFPVVALAKSSEGSGCGIPPFGFAQGRLLRKVREEWATLVRGGVGLQQVPHRASSPVRNDKLYYGLVARLKSCSSRSWRFPNPRRDGAVESHVSQKTRDMGHPRSWWRRLTAGQAQGLKSCPSRSFHKPRSFAQGVLVTSDRDLGGKS